MKDAKLIVKKGISKAGNIYCALILDLGYRRIYLNPARDNSVAVCAELLGYTVAEMLAESDGDIIVMRSI